MKNTCLLIFTSSLLALSACSESGDEFENLPVPTSSPSAAATTVVPPEFNSVGALTLSGEIAVDGNRMARVFPLVGGEVVRVGADLGDEVHRGQVLAVLKSGEIAALQSQSTAGTADLALARHALAVTEELYQAGLSAAQDVYKARKEVDRAVGTANRNQQQLGVYGVAPGGTYVLRAPVAGFITEKHLAAGLRFNTTNMEAAFTVANLDSIWVIANVFEADLSRVQQGQAVEVTTLSYPDKPLRGRLDKVFHILDHESKVMKVRCTLPNPGHRLKPGMHAQMRVLAPTVSRPAAAQLPR